MSDGTLDASIQEQHDIAYWESLIPETEAAKYMGLTPRCLQGWRYRGGGPNFVRISARCIRYRRRDLRAFADTKVRTSTSDPGQEAV